MELITLVFLGFVFLLSVKWLTKKRHNLPHHRGLPLVGNFFQLKGKKNFLELTEWSKELGEIFTFKMFHKEFVVLNSYEAIHCALVEKGRSFVNRPNSKAYRLQVLTDDFRHIVRTDYNQRFKKMRRMFHGTVKMYDTGLKRIEAINLRMLDGLVEDFKRSKGKSFNPKEIVYNTVMNVILTLLVGKAYKKDDELFQKSLRFEQTLVAILSPTGKGAELDILPWLRFFGNSSHRGIVEAMKLRDEIFEILMTESDNCSKDEKSVQLMSALKEGMATEFGELNEEAMKWLKAVSIFDTMFAGTTTTSHSTLSFMNTICQLPEVQKKLQEEIDLVVGKDRSASLSDRENLPYTHATMLELFRFSSVTSLGVPHLSVEDTEVCGKVIPAGVTVITNLWALHHDPSFWDDPFEFKPERFLTDTGDIVSASHPLRRRLMPFGAGTRSCLGEMLAKSRLFLIISTLAQKFTLKRGNLTAPLDARSYLPGMILGPQEFELIVEER